MGGNHNRCRLFAARCTRFVRLISATADFREHAGIELYQAMRLIAAERLTFHLSPATVGPLRRSR